MVGFIISRHPTRSAAKPWCRLGRRRKPRVVLCHGRTPAFLRFFQDGMTSASRCFGWPTSRTNSLIDARTAAYPRFEQAITLLYLWVAHPAAPNIAAAHGAGPAYAQPKVLSVLEQLDLVEDGRWTRGAELVLWRAQPTEWAMDITLDPRFTSSVQRTCRDIPDKIKAEIKGLVEISESDVAAAVSQRRAADEELLKKYGERARSNVLPTDEQARNSLSFTRRHQLDWLFFRHWRIGDGWLSSREAERALHIFHDRLAIAMRRSVMGKLFPGLTFFAD